MNSTILGPLVGMVAGGLLWVAAFIALGWPMTRDNEGLWSLAVEGGWIGAFVGGLIGYKAVHWLGLVPA